jgi:hypothetical protein
MKKRASFIRQSTIDRQFDCDMKTNKHGLMSDTFKFL